MRIFSNESVVQIPFDESNITPCGRANRYLPSLASAYLRPY
ncbi:MAG: hypothetical protein ACK5EQ_04475 [Bacteroidota bacterium]